MRQRNGPIGRTHTRWVSESLLVVVAEALAHLVTYVNARPEAATADDDVHALEYVAFLLQRCTAEEKDRLRSLLGSELADALGLSREPT